MCSFSAGGFDSGFGSDSDYDYGFGIDADVGCVVFGVVLGPVVGLQCLNVLLILTFFFFAIQVLPVALVLSNSVDSIKVITENS